MKSNLSRYEMVKSKFFETFEEIEGKKFDLSDSNPLKLDTLIHYFLKDPLFSSSALLNTNLSLPSFDKGLLLIGDYGTGKTSIIRGLLITLSSLNIRHITFKHVNDVVIEYECLTNGFDKKDFFENYNKGIWAFDDVLTEEVANNFGKLNLMKRLFENRSFHKKTTHCTCNYDENHPNDLKKGLFQFQTKYDGRVYDRLFDMFNIIEFKGKSMRR